MAMQNDPVCGMQVDEQKASTKSQHQGRTYYFCSSDCKQKFDQQPEQYAGQQSQGSAQA
jgi:P-type Cu+ transporter